MPSRKSKVELIKEKDENKSELRDKNKSELRDKNKEN